MNEILTFRILVLVSRSIVTFWDTKERRRQDSASVLRGFTTVSRHKRIRWSRESFGSRISDVASNSATKDHFFPSRTTHSCRFPILTSSLFFFTIESKESETHILLIMSYNVLKRYKWSRSVFCRKNTIQLYWWIHRLKYVSESFDLRTISTSGSRQYVRTIVNDVSRKHSVSHNVKRPSVNCTTSRARSSIFRVNQYELNLRRTRTTIWDPGKLIDWKYQ